MNTDTPRPVMPYAETAGAAQFTVGRYVVHMLAGLCVLAIVVVPLFWIGRYERIFADFKLTIPPFTRWLLMANDLGRRVYAFHWIWVIPVLLPLLTMRWSTTARRRVFAFGLLAVVLLATFMWIAVSAPMLALIEGVTGTGK